MALKTNETATLFAQKKLLGKAHTSNLNLDVNEAIGSTVQTSAGLLFGQAIPTAPVQNLYTVQSASNGSPATVEYVEFSLSSIAGSTYDANSSGGGAGSDSGESSQVSGPHAYAFTFKSDYESNTNNPLAGNGNFDNNKVVHETLGSVQLIPPFYSREAVNPYVIKIYKDNGSGGVGDEIPLLDDIDWQVDTYNGVLFVQDYNASKIPAHARAFVYVGKTIQEVVESSSGGGGDGDGGASYLVVSATGSLSNERVITVGTGLSSSDGGANGNFTLTNTNGNYVFNEYLGQANGSNTFFSLDHAPTAEKNVSVFVNGQLQMPATSITSAPFQDYSLTGSNIYFTSSSIPPINSILMANYTTNEAI